jgi:hypothetical protein
MVMKVSGDKEFNFARDFTSKLGLPGVWRRVVLSIHTKVAEEVASNLRTKNHEHLDSRLLHVSTVKPRYSATFFRRNLWRYIEGGCCVTGSFCLQTSMGAELRVALYLGLILSAQLQAITPHNNVILTSTVVGRQVTVCWSLDFNWTPLYIHIQSKPVITTSVYATPRL